MCWLSKATFWDEKPVRGVRRNMLSHVWNITQHGIVRQITLLILCMIWFETEFRHLEKKIPCVKFKLAVDSNFS